MSDLPLLHLVARTASNARPFDRRFACADLWAGITRSFDLVACVLMPDHVHVLAQIEREIALRTFARVLSAFRRRMQARNDEALAFDWEPLPQPEKVQRDRRHIARTLRYIHLNPTRDALCNDPLKWEWSTHRDWIGAVVHPKVDRNRWARAMGRRMPSCTEWLHEYVVSDHSVSCASPVADPASWLRAGERDASLEVIASAVARALRSPRSAPHEFGPAERRLFLLSASRWTHYRAAQLARYVGCHPSAARKMIRSACAVGEQIDGRAVGELVDRKHDGRHVDASEVPADRNRKNDAAGAPRRAAAAVAAGVEARVRRSPLTREELQAMALILADSRLSAMPLSPVDLRRGVSGRA
jgi:REP element-mobilizing transposase RayT